MSDKDTYPLNRRTLIRLLRLRRQIRRVLKSSWPSCLPYFDQLCKMLFELIDKLRHKTN